MGKLKEGENQQRNELQSIPTASARLKKLEDEIQQLSRATGRGTRVARYIPLLTACIAVAGFIFGIVKFVSEQAQDRRIRIQSQIRTDINELLLFTSDESQTISRALFLLQDIDALIINKSNEREDITQILAEIISKDCDFEDLRHVRLDVMAMRHWEGYEAYLIRNPAVHDFIMYKYVQALRVLHDMNPEYVEHIEYETESGYRVAEFAKESFYLHFESLVRGYVLHVRLLGDPDAQMEAIELFQEAVNNRTLTQQIFHRNYKTALYHLRSTSADSQGVNTIHSSGSEGK